MPSCFVPGCSSSWRTKDTALYSFPKEEARLRLWLQNMNIRQNDLEYHVTRIRQMGSKTFRVCSKHFTENYYVMGGQGLSLRFDAIPTLKMPPALEPQIAEHYEHNYGKRQKLITDPSEGEVRSDESSSFLGISQTSSGLNGLLLSTDSPEGEATSSVVPSSEPIYQTDPASPEMLADEIEVSTSDFFRESLTTFSKKRKKKGSPKKLKTTIGASTEYFPRQKHKAIQIDKLFMKKNKNVQVSIPTLKNSIGIQCDLVSLPPLTPLARAISFFEPKKWSQSGEPLLLQSSLCEADGSEQPSTPPVTYLTEQAIAEDSLNRRSTDLSTIRFWGDSKIEDNAKPKNALQDESYRPCVKEEEEENLQEMKEDFLIDPNDPDASFIHIEDQADKKFATERKFIVFESCLNELLLSNKCKFNENCQGRLIKIKKYLVGSALVVKGYCSERHKFHLWSSQPFVGKMPAGNLLISGSILCSGSNFDKVSNFFYLLGLCGISQATYYRNQNYYLFPIINHHWYEERKDVLTKIGQCTVALAGDGQCDSPGFSTKYCTYTFLDLNTDKIIDFQVEQSKTGVSSVSLGKIAFVKALQRLKDDNVKIKIIATDRHVSIRKLLKEQHKGIIHKFYVWHFAKSIGNKLHQASKRRNSHELAAWVSPAKNHLWWCASTCKHNVELLKEKWMSLVFHASNIHSWTDGQLYKQCSHEEMLHNEEEEHVWLLEGSAALQRMKDIVHDPRILKDLEHLSTFCHTGNLEVFHSMTLKYRTKHHRFGIDGMVARTQLAALDYNRNVGREQAKMYDDTTQKLMTDILADSISLAAGNLKVDWIPRQSYEPENIASFPFPEKPDMLQRYLSRFNH
ncbi:uncharacterized protein [Aquarana catesbeiana]|uniref:uncharacterized protein n=1 Tax=Aquarana catesbeiana TaxID=8400 RepID=UPI003CC9B9C3